MSEKWKTKKNCENKHFHYHKLFYNYTIYKLVVLVGSLINYFVTEIRECRSSPFLAGIKLEQLSFLLWLFVKC